MPLLGFAAVLALWGTATAIVATRFRHGRAAYLYLRRRSYATSWWPAARRNLPYGFYPFSAILLLTAATIAAQVAGVHGPFFSAVYLILVLGLGITMIVFMVTKPSWLAPPDTPAQRPADTRPDDDPVEMPPRPISEMTSEQWREWACADPERAKRLLRRTERDHGR